ncbi:MAG: TonB-dependent receptor, partial [Marinobacterium sp.]|nr:TonB-dependent receptor [Marinobacterium sp.]
YQQLRISQKGTVGNNQAYMVAASSLKDGGWRDHTARDRQELLAKHLWQLDDDNSLKTVLQLSRLDDESASSLLENQYRTDPTDNGLSDQVLAINPHRNSDFARLSVEWQHRINDRLSFSSIPYARYSTNDYVATWRSYTPIGETSIRTLGVLNKLDYRHDDGSTTLVGLDLERSESDSLSYQPFTVTTSGWSSNTYPQGFVYSDSTIEYQNLSPWLQHNWLMNEQLSLQLGLRYDYHRFELDNQLAETDDDGFGNRQLADRSDSFNSFSPKLALSYALTEESTVYGRVAQACRLPSASSLYSLKSGDSKSLAGGVEEETSTTYEVGYKLAKDALQLSLALYQMNIDDAIVSAYDSAGDHYRTNAGETRHRGLEIELGYRLSNDWKLQLALSESRHEFIDYVNGSTDYSGNDMKMAPETKGNLALNWTPQAITGLTTQLQLEYFGSYWMDDDNSRRADSYSVVNLKARYDANEQWSLFARIDNLLDEEYATQQEIRYGKARFYPGKPLTVNAGVRYRW